MTAKPTVIRSIAEAVDCLQHAFRDYPERDALAAHRAAMEGCWRKYPVFTMGHLGNPSDTGKPADELVLPKVTMNEGPEAELAREIIGLLTHFGTGPGHAASRSSDFGFVAGDAAADKKFVAHLFQAF